MWVVSTSDNRRYISVAEAARELGVSRQSVYRAIESGHVPVVRLEPRCAVRIPASALEARSQRR